MWKRADDGHTCDVHEKAESSAARRRSAIRRRDRRISPWAGGGGSLSSSIDRRSSQQVLLDLLQYTQENSSSASSSENSSGTDSAQASSSLQSSASSSASSFDAPRGEANIYPPQRRERNRNLSSLASILAEPLEQFAPFGSGYDLPSLSDLERIPSVLRGIRRAASPIPSASAENNPSSSSSLPSASSPWLRPPQVWPYTTRANPPQDVDLYERESSRPSSSIRTTPATAVHNPYLFSRDRGEAVPSSRTAGANPALLGDYPFGPSSSVYTYRYSVNRQTRRAGAGAGTADSEGRDSIPIVSSGLRHYRVIDGLGDRDRSLSPGPDEDHWDVTLDRLTTPTLDGPSILPPNNSTQRHHNPRRTYNSRHRLRNNHHEQADGLDIRDFFSTSQISPLDNPALICDYLSDAHDHDDEDDSENDHENGNDHHSSLANELLPTSSFESRDDLDPYRLLNPMLSSGSASGGGMGLPGLRERERERERLREREREIDREWSLGWGEVERPYYPGTDGERGVGRRIVRRRGVRGQGVPVERGGLTEIERQRERERILRREVEMERETASGRAVGVNIGTI